MWRKKKNTPTRENYNTENNYFDGFKELIFKKNFDTTHRLIKSSMIEKYRNSILFFDGSTNEEINTNKMHFEFIKKIYIDKFNFYTTLREELEIAELTGVWRNNIFTEGYATNYEDMGINILHSYIKQNSLQLDQTQQTEPELNTIDTDEKTQSKFTVPQKIKILDQLNIKGMMQEKGFTDFQTVQLLADIFERSEKSIRNNFDNQNHTTTAENYISELKKLTAKR